MRFRVPKSVILNDLENGIIALFCIILLNSAALGTNYVKVVEDRPSLSATKM